MRGPERTSRVTGTAMEWILHVCLDEPAETRRDIDELSAV